MLVHGGIAARCTHPLSLCDLSRKRTLRSPASRYYYTRGGDLPYFWGIGFQNVPEFIEGEGGNVKCEMREQNVAREKK
jgi:hypothetical protein